MFDGAPRKSTLATGLILWPRPAYKRLGESFSLEASLSSLSSGSGVYKLLPVR
jgi:hypothetical protein